MNSRRKGHGGEREFARLLREGLDMNVERNLEQTRNGGYDLELPGIALEVKRAAHVTPAKIKEWWRQAIAQAERCSRVPILAYREDRSPWRVRMLLLELYADAPQSGIVEMGTDEFCFIYKRFFADDESPF